MTDEHDDVGEDAAKPDSYLVPVSLPETLDDEGNENGFVPRKTALSDPEVPPDWSNCWRQLTDKLTQFWIATPTSTSLSRFGRPSGRGWMRWASSTPDRPTDLVPDLPDEQRPTPVVAEAG